jgi:hypothetical protein
MICNQRWNASLSRTVDPHLLFMTNQSLIGLRSLLPIMEAQVENISTSRKTLMEAYEWEKKEYEEDRDYFIR